MENNNKRFNGRENDFSTLLLPIFKINPADKLRIKKDISQSHFLQDSSEISPELPSWAPIQTREKTTDTLHGILSQTNAPVRRSIQVSDNNNKTEKSRYQESTYKLLWYFQPEQTWIGFQSGVENVKELELGY